MAVLTFGDILVQCQGITGIRDSETTAVAALKGGINTAHSRVCLAGTALGLSWMERVDIHIPFTATTTWLALPDGKTVLDDTGAVAPACMFVRAARLPSEGCPLTKRSKDVYEAEWGTLDYIERGIPDTFDVYGYNSLGQQLLWLMRRPNFAGVVALDYATYGVYLTALNQPLVPPEPFREVVAQYSIANVNALDTIDQAKVANARDNAEFMWRCIVSSSGQFRPRHQTIGGIRGQFQ